MDNELVGVTTDPTLLNLVPDELSSDERNKIEHEIFKKSIDDVWSDTRDFFQHYVIVGIL